MTINGMIVGFMEDSPTNIAIYIVNTFGFKKEPTILRINQEPTMAYGFLVQSRISSRKCAAQPIFKQKATWGQTPEHISFPLEMAIAGVLFGLTPRTGILQDDVHHFPRFLDFICFLDSLSFRRMMEYILRGCLRG